MTWIIPAIETTKLNVEEIKNKFSDLKKIRSVKINDKFKMIGVTAIEANFPSVFKYAPIRDVKQIKRTNGNVSLVKLIEWLNFSGLSEKPGAIRVIINGMKISKMRTNAKSATKRNEKIFEKKASALFLPDFVLTPETTGMNAAFIAPSPKILLNKLGHLKATKKQSEIKPAPITLAISKSLK